MKNFENPNQLRGDPLISAISKMQAVQHEGEWKDRYNKALYKLTCEKVNVEKKNHCYCNPSATTPDITSTQKKDGSFEINEKITKDLDVTSSNGLITLAQTITTNDDELKFFDPPYASDKYVINEVKKEESGNHNISNEEFEKDLDDDLDEVDLPISKELTSSRNCDLLFNISQLLETLAQDFNSNWWPLVSNVWIWFNLKKKANGDSSQKYTWHLTKHNQSSTQRRESQIINSENSEYEIMTREYWIKHVEIVSSLFIKNSPQELEQLQQLLKQSRHSTTHQPQIL
ncbi:hypothetical protein Glove_230g12 [Diversispora epigaea]|uniref:Uncharacterized protein n=1 Tax=Diversispora epigaea TaxID=1348612 RepID=A0A397IHB9_9GLOM|nr:hypothetical protein Glove_230g12 [Diversispora epigaea]